MSKFETIVNKSNYESSASSYSKYIITVFFISSFYMMFTNSHSVGWIGFIVYLFVGMFLSSILIALPFYFLERIFVKIGLFISIISIIVTFFAVKISFEWIFSESDQIITEQILPERFTENKEMLKESLVKFGEASDITNSPDKDASEEKTMIVISLTLDSIKAGEDVDDAFLDYLHEDLRYHYHEKFLKAQRLSYQGLSQSKDTDTLVSESVKKQIEASKLMGEWLNWWEKNNESIVNKIFAQ